MNQKHYTNSIFLLCMGIAVSSQAQHSNEFYNNGALVSITSGGDIHVLGDVHMRGVSGMLENNGLLKVQGDMYGDNLFQQRGMGETVLENSDVNIGQKQKIVGSFAIRGNSSANAGIDDGSFYILRLANDVGIIDLETSAIAGNTRYVADVRNGVDFFFAGTQNRIVTMPSGSVVPGTTDGPDYNAVFGIVNIGAHNTMGWAPGGMMNNSVQSGGNMSAVDAGYVQGVLRRRIDPAGGDYPFVIGLDPGAAGDKRGMQYIRLNFAANDYDMLEAYFDRDMDNSALIGQVECVNNWQVDYAGGPDHGQWVFNTPVGGSGVYSATVWPQDHNFPAKSQWFITKDNAIDGTPDQCGASTIGLSRSGFNGFSTLGVVGSDILLETKFIDLKATAINNNYIRVDWSTEKEKDVDHFVIERSTDDINFQSVATHPSAGNSTTVQSYYIDDHAVLPNINYYYRVKTMNIDGSSDYTHSVVASLHQDGTIEDVRVFPNPVKGGQVTVEITAAQERDFRFVVYDAIGQRIHQSSASMNVGYNQYTLYTKDWPSGAYFIHIIGDEFSNVQELIKRQD